jgi:uncharacterized protein (DUF302 family)
MLDCYLVETDKSFAEAVFDLTPVVQRLGFTVLNTYDFGETLFRKGAEFDEECAVFELGSERYLAQLLALDVRMAMFLPWRIAVFTQDSATKIGIWHPSSRAVPEAQAKLLRLLEEISAKLILIVDEVR